MSLEELKTLDATSLPVGKLISMIARGNNIYLNHKLEEFNINASQLHLMFEISHEKELNQEKIATRCNINKGSVARTIRKLEEKNLITRKIDNDNRRQNKVSLTPEGENILNECKMQFNLWEDEVINNNTFIDKITLKKALKEILIKTIELNQRRE